MVAATGGWRRAWGAGPARRGRERDAGITTEGRRSGYFVVPLQTRSPRAAASKRGAQLSTTGEEPNHVRQHRSDPHGRVEAHGGARPRGFRRLVQLERRDRPA